MLSPLLFNIVFAAILLVALSILRFSKDADILTYLAHLQEQSSEFGPETALECVRRDIWGMVYADDAYIVSRSPHGLERMIVVIVEVFGAFGLTVSESKMETMCMPTPRAPATQIIFNVTGQQYRQTTSSHLFGRRRHSNRKSVGQDRPADPCGGISFKRYTRELYDRPKASLLHL